MKIYCISGLGADYRVYDYLNLNYELLPPSGNTKTIIIKNGEHFMIVDRAIEVSSVINTYINKN